MTLSARINLRQINISRVLWWAVSMVMLWLAQPPGRFWLFALVAIAPMLIVAWGPSNKHEQSETKKSEASGSKESGLDKPARQEWMVYWLISTVYYLVSLQGIRHAHPVMYLGWMALSGYLAVYHVLFVAMVGRLVRASSQRSASMLLIAPLVWVATEWVRNYLVTGISVLMLGHTMADVPAMIQIADLFGSYGISAVVMTVNVAIALWWIKRTSGDPPPSTRVVWGGTVIASVALVATLGYGSYRLATNDGQVAASAPSPLATFALLQRNETIEFDQEYERQLEIFDNYADQAVGAVAGADRRIDAVVWPESMFSGAVPWQDIDEDGFEVPADAGISEREFRQRVSDSQTYWHSRNRYLSQRITAARPDQPPPVHLAGCGVIQYGRKPGAYSGLVHVGADGQLLQWYGKTHLVMFGEYVPLVKSIPWINQWVPPGLGLAIGDGPKRMRVGNTVVSPNICIETAVERVTVNQMTMPSLVSPMDGGLSDDAGPDVIVTVTNDGWFDDSSVIEHHLRCVQIVAVGCRRPILSAANNGPTAWVDHCGRIVERLPRRTHGTLIATPDRSPLNSLYTVIGDWPARMVTVIVLLAWLATLRLPRPASPPENQDDTSRSTSSEQSADESKKSPAETTPATC